MIERHRRFATAALAWLAATLCVVAAPARQSDGEASLAAMRWRSIGPYRGGRVTAVSGARHQRDVYYLGATGGGVWKTDDAGVTWRPISDGFLDRGSIGAIAVADSDPNVVYVGTGEACVRSNFSEGDGVYRSTDAGRTWTHVGLDLTRQIGRIVVDPSNPDVVYVAALGNVFGPSAERGVYRSKDGGRTWARVLFVDENTGAVDLSIDPRDSRVLYAGMWRVRRRPWNLDSGGPGSGLYKSTDAGDTWRPLTAGLPTGIKGRIGVAVSPVRSSRVWAIVEATDGGVFRSDDSGASWSRTNGESAIRERAWYYSHIIADPAALDTVYVLTLQINKSTDGGRSFKVVRPRHSDNHGLWIDPDDADRLINGNDGGANISVNGGRTWTTEDNQATGQFYHVITDGRFPYRIYGAQQDSSTVSIPSRTSSSGIAATDWYGVGGGESGYVAPDPSNPDIVYAGSYYGLLTRYDHATGDIHDVSVWPVTPGGRPAADVKFRFQWTFPIVASRHAPGTIYAGANILFKTSDGGSDWQAISPDLTRNDRAKQGPSGGPLTGDNSSADYYDTIFTVAESPLDAGTIWVGTDDGLVQVTRDGGQHWQNVTPRGMPDWARVSLVSASPHDAGTAYVAANHYQMDDRRPYIFKTADFGQTWTQVVQGLPDDAFVRAVREDPERRNLLYAATERGVFASADGGERWRSLQLNLPAVPVTDLVVHDADLVVSTQGRGFWVLDDVTPLRRPDPWTTEEGLVASRPAYRQRTAGFGRPAPDEGQNPPNGAIIYYMLRPGSSSPVSLEILDHAGTVVRRVESGGAAGRGLTADPGLNRFIWDLRYPGADPPPDGVLLFGGSTRGPVAVPGTYQARLKIGSSVSIRPIEIRADPRTRTSADGYTQQFTLLTSIRDRVTACHRAASEIVALRSRLARAGERARDAGQGRAGLSARIQEIADHLGTVLDRLVQPALKTGNDVLSHPVGLNSLIASIGSAVASSDSAPTRQSQLAFEELSKRLDAELATFATIKSTELQALNRELQRAGIGTIPPGR